MSGVKHATVQRKLDQALDTLDNQLSQLEQTVNKREQLGKKGYAQDKSNAIDAYQKIDLRATAEIADFIKQELHELQKKYQAIGIRVEHANRTDQAFMNAENQAKSMVNAAKQNVKRLQRQCRELEQRIQSSLCIFCSSCQSFLLARFVITQVPRKFHITNIY